MADITLPDGSRIPEYALESTQAEIMKLLSAQVKADEKSLAKYKELVDLAQKTSESNQDQEQLQDEQIKLLHGIREDSKKGKNNLGKGLNYLADGAIKAGTMLAGSALTAFGFAAKSAYNLGNTMAELGNVGIGLGGMEGAAIASMASLQRLGLSATEAATLMRDSSSIMAVMGQSAFVNMNSELAKITGSGAKFGMTMNQLAEVAREDLEIRQKLGLLDNLNASQAAKRSQEIYGQQLKATKLLGKSMEDIRGASANTLSSATMAVRVLSMGPNGEKFVQALQTGLGGLASIGLEDSIIDAIGNSIGSTIAFDGEEGQQLFNTLSVLDKKMGSGLTSSIQKMNELAKTDPEKVGPELEKFKKKMMDTAASMSPEDFAEYAAFLQSGELGAMGESLARSMAELRQAHDRYNKVYGEGADKAIEQFGNLAQGAKTFDNSMGQLRGAFGGMFTDLTGALGPAVGGLAAAFQDSADLQIEDGKVVKGQMGIATAFKHAMLDVTEIVLELFGGSMKDGAADFSTLTESLREKLVPAILSFGQWFKDHKDGIFDTLVGFKNLIVGVTAPFRALFNLLTGDFASAGENISNAFGSLGGKIGLAVAGFVILNKTLAAASAGKGIVSKVMGLFSKGGGGAGETVGKAGGGALGGIGKGIGALGKGIGKGIGGIFKGLAIGIGAFANPKILIGAGILAGSILLIGGAVAGATWMMGKALPTMAEGLEAFEGINGANLIDVGLGMLAVGAGIAAMGAGNVIGAVGNLVGGAFDKLNDLLGGPSIMDRVAEFAKWDIDVVRVENNSHALVAYGKGMGALGAAQGLAGIGNYISFISDSLVNLLGGDTPLEKVQKFSEMKFNKEGIQNAADAIFLYSVAMSRLADVEIPGATLSGLISDIGQGVLAFFGAESPLEKLKQFGDAGLNAAGIVTNARAILDYATAMSALKGVDVKDLDRATSGLLSDRSMAAYERLKAFSEMDIGTYALMEQGRGLAWFSEGMQSLAEVDADAAVTAIEKLAKAYGSFSMLNPERLVAVAEGMAAINDNAQQGVSLGSMDMGVAISTGLADLKASTPSPAPSDVQVPLLPGEKPASSKASDQTEATGNESLEALMRKNNTKMDELISVINNKM